MLASRRQLDGFRRIRAAMLSCLWSMDVIVRCRAFAALPPSTLGTPAWAAVSHLRIANAGYTGGRPAIAEIVIYSDRGCASVITGASLHGSSGALAHRTADLALDGSNSTSWRPQCSPCKAGEAWIEIVFESPQVVRCVAASNLGQGYDSGHHWHSGISVSLISHGMWPLQGSVHGNSFLLGEGSCSWTAYPNQVPHKCASSRCLPAVPWENRSFAPDVAKAKCLELGSVCSAVTCSNTGKECSIRSSPTLKWSQLGETTYVCEDCFNDRAYQGGSIGSVDAATAADCQRGCQAARACAHFTFLVSGPRRVCNLMSENTDRVSANTLCLQGDVDDGATSCISGPQYCGQYASEAIAWGKAALKEARNESEAKATETRKVADLTAALLRAHELGTSVDIFAPRTAVDWFELLETVVVAVCAGVGAYMISGKLPVRSGMSRGWASRAVFLCSALLACLQMAIVSGINLAIPLVMILMIACFVAPSWTWRSELKPFLWDQFAPTALTRFTTGIKKFFFVHVQSMLMFTVYVLYCCRTFPWSVIGRIVLFIDWAETFALVFFFARSTEVERDTLNDSTEYTWLHQRELDERMRMACTAGVLLDGLGKVIIYVAVFATGSTKYLPWYFLLVLTPLSWSIELYVKWTNSGHVRAREGTYHGSAARDFYFRIS